MSADAPPRRRRRRRRAIIVAALSTLGALGAAELLAGAVQSFAFPRLNIYTPDDAHGVRLSPHAETRLRSRDGRVTTVRTDARGYRAGPWPAPAAGDAPIPGRVLVLGDSQAFGLGVEAEEALGPRLEDALEARSGAPAEVFVAAVPTWGPMELARVAEALVPRYRPAAVVFVANLGNDWVEARQPNRLRVTARDGWAVPFDPSAGPTVDFPGRAWLLGRSHLVYTLRRALAGRSSGGPAAGGGVDWLLPRLARLRDGGPSPMTRHVLDVATTCRAHGCASLLAVLPLDVQVDPTAWSKYATPRRPLDTLRGLVAELMADAASRGVVPVDLYGPLADASPGAFLPDDDHLSPEGHAAVARAIAARIPRAPRPAPAASGAEATAPERRSPERRSDATAAPLPRHDEPLAQEAAQR